VEAAITLPIVLLLALGVTDIGRSFYQAHWSARAQPRT